MNARAALTGVTALLAVFVIAGADMPWRQGRDGGRSTPGLSPRTREAAAPAPPPRIALPPSSLSEEQRILHVLNRLGYGPRPGDVGRVRSMGLAVYIERQLDPGGIPDGPLEALLAGYATLDRAPEDLARDARLNPPAAAGMAAGARPGGVPAEQPWRRVAAELKAAKITRAVASERQLEAVMVDVWFNHFNVFAYKGAVRWTLADYERDALRPHALGRFRDLVVATARHPAMLYYLDNWVSTADGIIPLGGPNRGRRSGLNENYARELIELHTMGGDGGYTQQDVIEVARCFTGWSIDAPRRGGGYMFWPRAHDWGEKRVLGQVIAAGGDQSDGLRAIDILVRHPLTARSVATRLARRFVSDEPPAALVDRAARVFQETDGDIRAVLAAIFSSPEFFAPEAYRAKVKTPLELVASAVRGLGGAVAAPAGAGAPSPGGGFDLAVEVAGMGQPLYEAQTPAGYPDVAEAWVNTGTLVGRMNFALALADDRIPGVAIEPAAFLRAADGRAESVGDRLASSVLGGEARPETRRVLAAQLGAMDEAKARRLIALMLASPEFQRK